MTVRMSVTEELEAAPETEVSINGSELVFSFSFEH